QIGGAPVDSSTIALLLEARDAMQGMLEHLAGRSRAFILPTHLLEQLGLETSPKSKAASEAVASAFRNTALQCLEIFDNCLHQMEGGQAGRALLKAYQRVLKTLASAAAYQHRSDLEESVASQLRILDAALRSGGILTREDQNHLREGYYATRSRIDRQCVAAPGAVQKSTLAPGAPRQTSTASASSTTIRIDQEKLDRLMRVVGELLVAKGAFPTLVAKVAAGEDRVVLTRAIKDTGAGISHIAEELQASVMAIRMLPVKTVFQRFPRLVRDLARSLGKDVQLVIEGETVELDKTILEQIGDPLVHLVRNAVDHGLEPPDERRRSGKEASGRLRLRASNNAGNVCIEVDDDGRGLNTAEKVTEVSGRGVGMDVVRNNIRDLQGTVDISSTPGVGTAFSIKLPTSLIVSKGILLEAGGQEYILPLTCIR